MLLKDNGETPRKLQNMHISHFPAMCLFHTSIDPSTNTLIVSYLPPAGSSSSVTPEEDTLEIPLEPSDLAVLEKIPVEMHKSPTTAVNMGSKYNAWFSARFGFSVILAFWAGNPRPVLGNVPNKTYPPSPANPMAARSLTSLPVMIKNILLRRPVDENDKIAFNDCAPYLIISATSVDEVSTRLPPDTMMDATKFRANIVVQGAREAYGEDYWSELSFTTTTTTNNNNNNNTKSSNPKILLTSNCGRCASLNVDYTTGATSTSSERQVLKLLQRDRRIDLGTKYSPVFGRYGFISGPGCEGATLSVGDAVAVTGKNEKRTRFCE